MPVLRSVRPLLSLVAVTLVVAFAVWLLLREDLGGLVLVLRDSNWTLISLAVAAYFGSVLVWAARWRTALASLDCHVSIATLWMIVLSGVFLNNVTPVMRVGGDPVGRVYLLQKMARTGYSSSMAASIGEHAFDPLFAMLFLTGGLFLVLNGSSPALAAVVLMVGTTSAAGAVFGSRHLLWQRIGAKPVGRLLGRACSWISSRTDEQRITKGVELFYTAICTTINTWRKGIQVGSLTAVMWVLDVLRLYVIFISLGYNPSLGLLLLASSLPSIVGLIPFLPGGLVIVEGSLVATFVFFGVPLEIAVAVTLIERGISYVLSTIVGGGVFSYLGVKTAVT